MKNLFVILSVLIICSCAPKLTPITSESQKSRIVNVEIHNASQYNIYSDGLNFLIKNGHRDSDIYKQKYEDKKVLGTFCDTQPTYLGSYICCSDYVFEAQDGMFTISIGNPSWKIDGATKYYEKINSIEQMERVNMIWDKFINDIERYIRT